MKRNVYAGVILLVIVVVFMTIGVTYCRFALQKSVTGSIIVPEDNYCINNGFAKLSDCMLIMDSASSSVDEAMTYIKTKNADFSVSEPQIVYKKVVTEGVTGTALTSTTSVVYFSPVEPTLNLETGYYTFPSSTSVLGFIPDYLSTSDKKYYTCMNQSSTGVCTTVYAIYSYTETTTNGATTYKVTKADKYTQVVTDTASSMPGLYYATDDYGDSYYYRGNVSNNYVSFAGYIWRIVRRNGDGSIRMIYSGTDTSASGSATSIGTSAFNSNRFDMASVGYKYGLNQTLKHTTNTLTYTNIAASTVYYYSDSYACDDTTKTCKLTGNMISGSWISSYSTILNGNSANGNVPYKYTCWGTTSTATCSIVSEITGTVTTNSAINTTQAKVKYHGYLSNSYADTYLDNQDSTIKTKIDTWYVTNILNKNDNMGNSYADYLADVSFCNDRSINSGDGETLEKTTIYGPYYRIYTTKTPTLNCPRDEDKFTVGNGKLSYPIALITIDEVAMAGGKYANMNSLYYLYTGQTYWTMSPSSFSSRSASARVWYVNSAGTLSNNYSSTAYGVRPVINLSSDILISGGTGTASNPYIVALSS